MIDLRGSSDAARLTQCAAILLGAILLLVGWGVGHSGAGVLGWRNGDMAASYFYWREFGFGELARGRFPGWNPYTFCGNPFAANYETALFYPLNWHFMLMPTAWAINISVVGHVWLGGILTLLLARRIGLGWSAALMAAFVYTLGGPLLGRVYVGHLTIVCALAWWPGVLLAIENLLRNPTPRAAGLAAGCYAMLIVAGHPQILYYGSVLAVVYAAIRLATIGANPLRPILFLAAACATGIALGSTPLLLTYYATLEGSRQALTPESASTFSFPPIGFIGTLIPWFFGDGIRSPYWGPWYMWEISVYTGIVPLVLAAIAGCASLRNPRAPAFSLAMILAIALVVAVGSATPLFWVLFNWLPGFGSFRGVGKVLGLALLPVAILAAIGFDQICFPPWRNHRWILPSIGIVLLAAVLAMGWMASGTDGQKYGFEQLTGHFDIGSMLEMNRFQLSQFAAPIVGAITRQSLIAAVAVILAFAALVLLARGNRRAPVFVLALVLADLLVAHRVLFVTFPSSSRGLPAELSGQANSDRILIADPSLSPNVALSGRIRTASGYEPLYPRRFGEFINAVNLKSRQNYDPLPEPRRVGDLFRASGTVAYWDGKAVAPIPNSLSRVLFFSTALVVANSGESWDMIADRLFDPTTTLVIEAPGLVLTKGLGEVATPRLVEDAPSRVTVELDSTAGGFLYLADTWNSGWSATVNGEPAPVYPANHAFRAVPVPPGPVRVGFVYTPPGLRLGLGITLAGFVALGALVWWPRRRGVGELAESRPDMQSPTGTPEGTTPTSTHTPP